MAGRVGVVGAMPAWKIVGRARTARTRAALIVWLVVALIGACSPAASASPVPTGWFTFNAPEAVDGGAPYGAPAGFDTISCPSSGLCVADTGHFGQIVTSTNPAGTAPGDWSLLPTSQLSQTAPRFELSGVSCVTQGSGPYCLATGGDPTGDAQGGAAVILSSSNPTGGANAWSVVRISPTAPIDVAPSCAAGPSTPVCVTAANGADGTSILWASTDPAGPQASWNGGATLDAPVAAVACPSAARCFVAETTGTVLSSTTPGNASSYASTASSTGLASLTTLSCPTPSFCIATGSTGSGFQIATSTNPDAATPTWTVSTPPVPLAAVACSPDSSLAAPHAICFSSAVSVTGVSLDGGQSWAPESLAAGLSNAFTCAGATASLCVAGTADGEVSSSATAATPGSSTWTAPLFVAPGEDPVVLSPQSCPSVDLCVGSDGAGRILTSTSPTGGAAAWSSRLVDPSGGGIFELACPSPSACVAFDENGSVLTSSNPAGGGQAWSAPSASIDPDGISALVCPSSTTCVAADFGGKVLSSSTPPFGAASWSTPAPVAGTSFLATLACPTSTACVGIDVTGRVHVSSTPPFAAATWSTSSTSVDDSPIVQLACPSSDLCIAIDAEGRLLSGGAPFTRQFWSAPSTGGIDPAPITQLVCPRSTLCLAADIDGNVLSNTITSAGPSAAWMKGAVDPYQSATGLACAFDVFCVVGDEAGNVIASARVAPHAEQRPTITGTPVVGQTLTASHASWTGHPTAISDQWTDCDPQGHTFVCRTIAGATSLTYTLTRSDADHAIIMDETAVSSGGSATALSHATAVVTSGPINTAAPSITGTSIAGSTLAGTLGAWLGTQPITYGYQWQRCGSTCANVQGATHATYALGPADVCAKVRLTITAHNSLGTTSAASPRLGPIAAGAARERAGLLAQIVPHGAAARLATLRANHAVTLPFTSTCGGTLAVRFTVTPPRHGRSTPRPVILASGHAMFSKAERRTIVVRLTPAGRRLLSVSTAPLTVMDLAAFTPPGHRAVGAATQFTLRR